MGAFLSLLSSNVVPAIAGIAFIMAVAIPVFRRYLLNQRNDSRLASMGGTATRGRKKQTKASGPSRGVLDHLSLLRSVREKLAHLGFGHMVTSYVLMIAAIAFAIPQVAAVNQISPLAQSFIWLAALHIFADRVVLDTLVERRKQKLKMQMPMAMDTMVRVLRIGKSIEFALQMAAEQIADPMGREFAIVNRMVSIGSPPEAALRYAAKHMDIAEFDFFVAAYGIHLETGGDLTHALEALSKTIRERINLKSKTEALVAESKLSGYMIGIMPIALMGYMSLVNPDYIEPLFETETGNLMLTVAGVLLMVGVIVITKLTRIRI